MVHNQETFDSSTNDRKTINPGDDFNRIQDGLKRPFFSISKGINLDEEAVAKFKSILGKSRETVALSDTTQVELLILDIIEEIGLYDDIDDETEKPLVNSTIKTVYEYYKSEFWDNYYIRARLNVHKLQALHDATESYEEKPGLLSVIRAINQRTSDSDSHKKNILMDSERIVRILILDEVEILGT